MTSAERQLRKFPGGLSLPGFKAASTAQPIATAPPCAEYILPLSQHIGDPAEPVIQPGARVLKGQLLAGRSGYISASVHAPTSGTITAIADRLVPHPSGLTDRCIILEADGRDEWTERKPLTAFNTLTPDEVREHIADAGIVGLGGAVFPAHIKLGGVNPDGIEMLILNGAECEPHISCDDMLMRERAAEILHGAGIMLHALQAPRCLIAVESDKPEAMDALRRALAELGDARLEVVEVPCVYPQGGEKQLIQTLTGREVPSGGLPLDIGLVCHNVGTAAAVYRAISLGEPLISRIVTVTGKGVQSARNLEVLIGTPISVLTEYCGGYTSEAARLIMGGSMMGFALGSDAIPVVKAANCILVAGATEIQLDKDPMPCIRCGECARVCPAGLLPQQLYWHTAAREFDKVHEYQLFDCIECGCCDIACPSHIPLVSYFRFAKTEIWGQEIERVKAELARRRFEARQARLQREQTEREARLERKRPSLAGKDPQAEIAAARERARKKHENKQD